MFAAKMARTGVKGKHQRFFGLLFADRVQTFMLDLSIVTQIF